MVASHDSSGLLTYITRSGVGDSVRIRRCYHSAKALTDIADANHPIDVVVVLPEQSRTLAEAMRLNPITYKDPPKCLSGGSRCAGRPP